MVAVNKNNIFVVQSVELCIHQNIQTNTSTNTGKPMNVGFQWIESFVLQIAHSEPPSLRNEIISDACIRNNLKFFKPPVTLLNWQRIEMTARRWVGGSEI